MLIKPSPCILMCSYFWTLKSLHSPKSPHSSFLPLFCLFSFLCPWRSRQTSLELAKRRATVQK